MSLSAPGLDNCCLGWGWSMQAVTSIFLEVPVSSFNLLDSCPTPSPHLFFKIVVHKKIISYTKWYPRMNSPYLFYATFTCFLGQTCSTKSKMSPPPQRVYSLSSSPKGFLWKLRFPRSEYLLSSLTCTWNCYLTIWYILIVLYLTLG